MFIIVEKLNKKIAKKNFKLLQKWFDDNPRRRVCNTDYGKVRRAHMKEDFLRFCVDDTKL